MQSMKNSAVNTLNIIAYCGSKPLSQKVVLVVSAVKRENIKEAIV